MESRESRFSQIKSQQNVTSCRKEKENNAFPSNEEAICSRSYSNLILTRLYILMLFATDRPKQGGKNDRRCFLRCSGVVFDSG